MKQEAAMKGFGPALGLFMVCLTGCAFGNRSVYLAYPPGASAAARALPEPTPAPNATKVVLVRFLDQRQAKRAVGAVHNGFGAHTADAVATNNVVEWIMKAINTELVNKGFAVIELADIPQTTDAPVIAGDVLTVMCQAWTKYEATVEFSATVSSGGKIILQKTYKGVDETTTNWASSGETFGLTLSAALRTAAENFAEEFKQLASTTSSQ
jgi:hypothetical protein